MAQHSKILIIGAGISGLAAAEKLEQKGLTDYKILEASDRVGGRIKSLKQHQDGWDYFLELGAGWVHGSKINPVYKLAKENGLLKQWGKKPTDPRLTVGNTQYWTEGNIIGKKHWQEVKKYYGEALIAADKLFTKDTLDENDKDLRSFIEEYVEQKLDPRDKEKYETKKKILNMLITAEAGIVGCQDLNEVSANQVGSYRPGNDAWHVLPKGYESVVSLIKSNIPDDKILLNHPVSLIATDMEGGSEKACMVTCKNNEVFTADHVIVTVSLGYLKDHRSTLFSPPLPEDKISAIKKLGYGTANRIYAEFENLDFLAEKTLGEIFLVKDTESSSDAWEDHLYSFYCQDQVPKANILTTWLLEEYAIAIEKLSDDEIQSKLQETLQKYLKVPVPMPTRIIRSAWRSEPYICGSWSFIKLGSCVKDINNLAEPVMQKVTDKPILLFAGEATHDRFYSSTPGAYLSGQREANRLIGLASN